MTFNNKQPAYESFRSIASEGTSSLVIWIGAGLSKGAGLPSWEGLRDALISSWNEKIQSFEESDRALQLKKLENAEKSNNMWLSFQMIEEGLGHTTFRDVIREQLAEAPRANIPEVYLRLWNMRLKGILNLNLDRLATRSYADRHSSHLPHEFHGFEIQNVFHITAVPLTFTAKPSAEYRAVASPVDPLEAAPSSLVFRIG